MTRTCNKCVYQKRHDTTQKSKKFALGCIMGACLKQLERREDHSGLEKPQDYRASAEPWAWHSAQLIDQRE
jgi:hypothetical protein